MHNCIIPIITMPNNRCIHHIQKRYCKACHGYDICQHGVQRRYCRVCHGYGICEHDKRRECCKLCGGVNVCMKPDCQTIVNPRKYGGYCQKCWYASDPTKALLTLQGSRAHNNRIKELAVVSYVKGYTEARKDMDNWVDKEGNALPDWVLNKASGASQKRPDLMLRMRRCVIIVEVDEHGHRLYDAEKDEERTDMIAYDLGHIPVIFIRFNPDSYITREGAKIRSCWGKDAQGLAFIKHQEDWDLRLKALLAMIKRYIDKPLEYGIEQDYLYYN